MGRRTRFSAEPGTVVLFGKQDFSGEFEQEHVGLALNESFDGAAVVGPATDLYQKADRVWVKVGDLDVMLAEIMWVKQIDDDVSKIGLKYVEEKKD